MLSIRSKDENHSEARTVLVPPFHASMARACNILAMESCKTQNVVAAIERHSARYGVPGYIYIYV